MAVFFFFGFPKALATFFSTPVLRLERTAGFLAAFRAVFLAAGVFFSAGLDFLFAALLTAPFLVVFVVGVRFAVVDFVAFFAPLPFLAGLLFAVVVFTVVFLLTGLRGVLVFTVVLFVAATVPLLAAGLFFTTVFLLAIVAGLRFFAVLVLFLAAVPLFAAAAVLLFLGVAVPFFTAAAVLLFLAGVVLFFAVEAVLLPLAALEGFLETAVFFPAALVDLLAALLLPAGVLFFGIVVSLLTKHHSISVFLLIW